MNNYNNNKPSPSWIQWLIGLLDAEGNFQVSPKKRTNSKGVITHYGVLVGFHLGMHIRDYALLVHIQQMLSGLGTIYLYPDKQEAHFAITKKAELQIFIELIISQFQLLTSYQLQRFLVLNKVLCENIVRVPTLEGFQAQLNTSFEAPLLNSSIPFLSSWIVGFINGEGSFSIVKNGKVFIFLLEHTDLAVLELIKEVLGFALPVYTVKLREGRKQTFAIKVSSRSDIGKVVSFLDANEPLKGYKLEQYFSWKEKWMTKNQ